MQRTEASPEELRELLRQRADQLVDLIDSNSPALEEYVLKEAAMVFHAAIRLSSKQAMSLTLEIVAKKHDCYLAGICEGCCRQSVVGEHHHCAACVEQYEKTLKAIEDKMLDVLLNDFESEKVQ